MRFVLTLESNVTSMRYAALYIILFFCIEKNYAQNFPNLQFSHLAENEGLSNNQVNTIAQDNEGFIWIGTSDGLNRFDGYRVRTFHQLPGEKNSLILNSVYNLVCDHKNGIWISTGEGISYYKKTTGQFLNFRHNPADSNSLSNDEYTNVYLPDDNTAWITNTSMLYRFDSLLHYQKILPGFRFVFDNKEVYSYAFLTQDRQQQLWAATANKLFLLDKHSLQVKRRFENCPGAIRTIFQDSQGQYWIGSFLGGLLKFNPATGHFEAVPLANKSPVVNCITEWKDEHGANWLVLGTDAGLVLLDAVGLKSRDYHYQSGSMEKYSLSGNNVSSVFVDRQNILWVGTNGGVSYVRPAQQKFELWSLGTSENSYRENIADYVYSTDENSFGLWCSTWLKKGIFLFNRSGEIQENFFARKKQILLDSLKPFFIRCEGDSVLWFTTDDALVQLNLTTGKTNAYLPPGKNFFVGLRTILPVNDHAWWIRTRNNGANGLYVFDPVEKKFTRHYEYALNKKGSVPMFLMDIFLSRKKEIFLAARENGLFQFDSSTNSFIQLFQFTGEQLLSHSNDFECIAEDKKGLLWIGTSKSLLAFDPLTKKIAHDYTNDPLIGGVEIEALRFDAQQNLWMNSSRGLYCLTTYGQLKHFSSADGLPNNFADGVLRSGKDGYMYAGLRNYLIRFKPDELVKTTSPVANVHFSEASVMDKPYFFTYNSSGEKEMTIEAGQNRFALDFSILNYDNNHNKTYYYRLDDAMNNWQQNENGHLVFYNVAPGSYTLHVKGTDRANLSALEEDIVHISVKPYWWQATWFWLTCSVVVILLAAFIIRRNIANIRKQAAFKQKLAETEMTALRAQMNPHFIFNSLNSIENFIMQNKEREASDYLNKFARLIRIILENSHHNVITVAQDMEALQLYVDLEQFRFNNKFSYRVRIDKELVEDSYRVPPLLIQPFVENAIAHGLANSDQPDLQLNVEAKLEGDCIKYTIEDNGVGRKKAALYRSQNGHKHKSVGLHITRERINLFNRQRSAGDEVTIVDLYDKEGNASGTRSVIKIKPA